MRRLLCFILTLLLCCGVGWSQRKQVTVTGKVIAASDKSPIIAASIGCLEYPKAGTVTDPQGQFTLKLPAEAKTLLVRCVGYHTQKVAITDKALTVILKEEERVMDGVVITGYGTTRKSSFAGSATTISTKNMKDIPAVSVTDKLSGAIAGLNISSSSGQPGTNSSISIRGLGSINSGSEPLFVIDGIPVNNDNASNFSYAIGGASPLATLNSNDIENITVIKDAGAAALYGSRAANGVIIITTKGGRSGKTSYTFKSDWGFSDMAINYRPTLSGEDRRALLDHAYRNYYQSQKNKQGQPLYSPEQVEEQTKKSLDNFAPLPWSGRYTDWRKELLRKGSTQNYEFSLSGGSSKTKFYTSLAYASQKGITKASSFDRVTGTANISHTDRRLALRAKVLFSRSKQFANSDGQSYANPIYGIAVTLSPSDFPRYADGTYAESFKGNNNNNILFALENNIMNTNLTRVNPTLDVQFTLFPWLKAKQVVGYDYLSSQEDVWWDPRQGDGQASQGVKLRNNLERATLTTQSQLLGGHSFDKHHLSGIASFETEQLHYTNLYLYGHHYTSYKKNEIDNSGSNSSGSSIGDTRLLSLLGKVDYDYDGRYILGASIRWDGSSRLAPKHRWGTFWSLSGSWNIGQEKFMQPLQDYLSDTRLRLSYGENGTLPLNYNEYLARYGFGYNYLSDPGMAETSLGAPDLTWEKNKSLNIGLDFKLFRRLSITFDYYNRKTTDLILYKSISQTTGFPQELQNLGSMRNTGFELEIRSANLSSRDFSWTTTLSLAHNKNTLLRYDGVLDQVIESSLIHRVGQPYNAFYLREYAGVDPNTGDALYYKNTLGKDGAIDRSLTSDPNEAQRRLVSDKPYNPVLTGGIINSLRWGNFDLNFTLSYSLGGYLYDAAVALYKDGNPEMSSLAISSYYDINKIWKKPGDHAELPRFDLGNRYVTSDRFLFSTDHLRLKNLSLGFTAPKQWTKPLGISSLRLYAAGANLLTWKSKRLPVDPEVVGYAYYETPALRTITFGLQVGI